MARNRTKSSRHQAEVDCRVGHHRFGPSTEAAGGILRRTCLDCGSLSIDLTTLESRTAGTFTSERIPFPTTRETTGRS